MNVLLLTESYDPVINGVTTSVHTLADELRAAGDTVHLAAPRFAGHVDCDPFVRRLPSWTSPFNPNNPFVYPPFPPRAVPAAIADLAGEIDVVHTQQPFGIGQIGRNVARAAGVPLVSTFHTLYTEYVHYAPLFPAWLAKAYLRGYLRHYYATCDAVIAPSQAMADFLVSGIGVAPNKITVIPSGIPDPLPVSDDEKSRARTRFGLPEDLTVPVVLYVGRLAREKSLDLLFDAFASFADPTAHLLVVGSGPYAAACEARAATLTRVHLAGFVPRAQLPPIYAAATVFAFPSATETQGMVVAEAQSYGLPCVVVDGGGAYEGVRDGIDGFIAPSGNTAAFAAHLTRLLSDTALRQAFGAAARHSPRRQTPEQMAKFVRAVYDRADGSPV